MIGPAPQAGQLDWHHRHKQENDEQESNMQFGATPEQDMIVETVRSFVEQEIYPLEDKIEK